ncbi:MAG: endonuclease/exonuclease/phosphatase family protein [Fimbriimonadaceae bacterium]|nr:endonuclease/exonuclease/phosphatase family protein [Fimbriimonadaceae bacterium]
MSVGLTTMTFNLRYSTAPDGANAWPNRRDALLAIIRHHDPDVLGVQEALADQIDDLRAWMPQHDVLGAGRDDGLRKGEHSSVFYRRNLLGLREGGTRWISPTPKVPGSLAFEARITRVFTWGEFFLASGGLVLVANAHLDHESPRARLLGGEMMRGVVQDRGLPAVVMGDFNCAAQEPPVLALTQSGLMAEALPAKGASVTFHGFDDTKTDGDMIDHVLHTKEWRCEWANIDRSRVGGRMPSDHFPVVARLILG